MDCFYIWNNRLDKFLTLKYFLAEKIFWANNQKDICLIYINLNLLALDFSELWLARTMVAAILKNDKDILMKQKVIDARI